MTFVIEKLLMKVMKLRVL